MTGREPELTSKKTSQQTKVASRNGIQVSFDENTIEAIFSELDQCHLPGAAVGIAIGGRPVYRKGFGLASMELPIVLSTTMRMRIYSTSKQFTCLAYMLLCEESEAAIDDELGKHLPELHPVAHRVTMRQLMGNVGGLRDALEINWAFGGVAPRVSSDDLLTLYRDVSDVNFVPGTSWRYSNGGFLLLGAVIERITGQPLEQVLWERIFQPIGMYDTLLRRWDTDFVVNSATMHMTKPGGGFDRFYEGVALDGGAGVVSTVDDMLRWLAHMDTPWIGSDGTWELMKSPQMLANGTSTNYGLGLFVSRYRSVEIIHHPGGGLGANSQMLKVPAADLDVVVLANRHDAQCVPLANRIVDACLPSLPPVSRRSSLLISSGLYHSPTTGRVIELGSHSNGPLDEVKQRVSINGADYLFERFGCDDSALCPAGGEDPPKITLMLVGGLEKATSLRLSEYGQVDELMQVRPCETTVVEGIAGRYRSELIDAQCTLSDSGLGLRLDAQGRFGSVTYDLKHLGGNFWRIRPTPSSRSFIQGILSFDSEREGFCFSTNGTLSVWFSRCRSEDDGLAVNSLRSRRNEGAR